MAANLIFFNILWEDEAEYGNQSDTATARGGHFTGDDQSNIYLGGVSVKDCTSQAFRNSRALLQLIQKYEEKYRSTLSRLLFTLAPQGILLCGWEWWFQASQNVHHRTYSKYNSVDDKIDDFHYYTFFKFGIGRTYDALRKYAMMS